MSNDRRIPSAVVCILLAFISGSSAASDKLTKWLQPQNWQRDTQGPVVSLGSKNHFDSRHIFAPLVARLNGKFWLWYCGSQGTVQNRVFRLGLAISSNGRKFVRSDRSPVYEFGDGKHSVLTPTLLRRPDGSVLRENGKLRMWFSATHFAGGTDVHYLHEASSTDGKSWTRPGSGLLKDVYAPTIIKEGAVYRMWYTDVGVKNWVIRGARSMDGKAWVKDKQPALVRTQSWERQRLFYPTVLKADGVYLMWYGSYWAKHGPRTAIGFAVSRDGKVWRKHAENPVLRPHPGRPWESHYTTSQSVLRLPDGRFRIWYASRKKPPFVNKYFAINTAVWKPLMNANNR